MKVSQRRRALWIATFAALVVCALAISFLVFARDDGADITLTATSYSDVVRFEAIGVDSLRIRIYDMSESELWDSGEGWSDYVDWDRTDEWGERLANGYYVYLAQGWNEANGLVLTKAGKVVLMPGDQVQLQSSPALSSSISDSSLGSTIAPLAEVVNDSLEVNGTITTTTAGDSDNRLHVYTGPTGDRAAFRLHAELTGDHATFSIRADELDCLFTVWDNSDAVWKTAYAFMYDEPNPVFSFKDNDVMDVGSLGVGTSDLTAAVTIEAKSGDLIAAYNSSERVFAVESDGTVRADGTVYAASFETGSADVAERINTSEWVEPGDVVEIDPDHAGFFRKARDPYSRRVAGIISTSPGVILGNSSDPLGDAWEDSRPVLAITGRVPVKVSTENGPIAVGDLLVGSSVPGVAMRGDPAQSIGAVVGKAMEPFAEGQGLIMAQVMLR